MAEFSGQVCIGILVSVALFCPLPLLRTSSMAAGSRPHLRPSTMASQASARLEAGIACC